MASTTLALFMYVRGYFISEFTWTRRKPTRHVSLSFTCRVRTMSYKASRYPFFVCSLVLLSIRVGLCQINSNRVSRKGKPSSSQDCLCRDYRQTMKMANPDRTVSGKILLNRTMACISMALSELGAHGISCFFMMRSRKLGSSCIN